METGEFITGAPFRCTATALAHSLARSADARERGACEAGGGGLVGGDGSPGTDMQRAKRSDGPLERALQIAKRSLR